MNKQRRKFFGETLIGIARLHEGQVEVLISMSAANAKYLSEKERKVVRTAIYLLNKSNRYLRVLGNRLTQ